MAATRGPGPLLWVHRLTIGTALAGAIVYTGWELRRFLRGETDGLWWGLLAAAAAVGIGVYFRSLRRLGAKLSGEGRRS